MNNNQRIIGQRFIDQTALDAIQIIKCPYKERTPVSRLRQYLTPGQLPEEIFKECCYTHLTLADLNCSARF
jgi:hypothetical protein